MKRAFRFEFVANIPEGARLGVVERDGGALLVCVAPDQPAKMLDIQRGSFVELKMIGDMVLKAL